MSQLLNISKPIVLRPVSKKKPRLIVTAEATVERKGSSSGNYTR